MTIHPISLVLQLSRRLPWLEAQNHAISRVGIGTKTTKLISTSVHRLMSLLVGPLSWYMLGGLQKGQLWHIMMFVVVTLLTKCKYCVIVVYFVIIIQCQAFSVTDLFSNIHVASLFPFSPTCIFPFSLQSFI